LQCVAAMRVALVARHCNALTHSYVLQFVLQCVAVIHVAVCAAVCCSHECCSVSCCCRMLQSVTIYMYIHIYVHTYIHIYGRGNELRSELTFGQDD